MSLRKFFTFFIAAVFVVLPLQAFAEEIVIYHTNDMHSRVLPTDDGNKSIGITTISAYVKNARAQNRNTLWLDAGDTFHGLPIINVSKGENMVKLLNAAELNALSPGNHDFNYSADRLEELTKKCKFPVLSANVFWKKNGERLLDAYKIFTLENGVKVGVFGLTTPDTLVKANPLYMDKLNFLDIFAKTREVVKVLKPECDIIIGLTHLGVSGNDSVTSIEVAKQAPGIDVIIDGHSHTELPNGITVNNTLIAQAGCYEHWLGKVTIDIDDKKITKKTAKLIGKDEIVKATPKPDEKVESVLKEIEKKNAKILNEVVAVAPKDLTGERNIVRREEAEFGNIIADAFLDATDADLVILNGGTIRTGLKKGNITKNDILTVLPFGNMLVTIKAKGKDIKDALEHSVEFYPHEFGGFLQVSGVTFEFDPTLPKGERVKNILIKGAPLDENKSYIIASTDFLFNGGDGYSMFKGIEIQKSYETADEAVINYLNKIKNFDVKLERIKCLKPMPAPNMGKSKQQSAKNITPISKNANETKKAA